MLELYDYGLFYPSFVHAGILRIKYRERENFCELGKEKKS